ncbi:MAG TPA: hypothetical protein VEO54_04750 [Thermoanaerobaculia bacterium]|nr:hypothetical protein [Thermoanaerobaculia bacterium]
MTPSPPPVVQQQTRSRYPGTHPFGDTPGDQARFFGRDQEAEELYLRVLSVKLLVQFGVSGLGKTSLLQAGLFPKLRQKPFLPAMLRLNSPGESLIATVTRALSDACAAEGLEFIAGDPAGVWELLATTAIWREDLLLTPVLVFDQFEEVFTLRDAAFRAELAAELGALASGKPPARLEGTPRGTPTAKIILSLREDHLGELEEFSSALPALFHERLRLEAMSEAAAREAITGPAKLEPAPGEPPYASPRFELEQAALDEMIASLKGISGVIEPFQLQLLCGHAEAIAARKGSGFVTLTQDDFRGAQRFEKVFENFYRGTLDRLPVPQRRKAAELCEEGLLDGAGHRLMLNERQIIADYRLTRQSLETLCNARLLRTERRLESTFYEISHDQLADSIVKARHRRLPRKVRRWLWAAGAAAIVIAILLVAWTQSVRRQSERAEKLVGFLLSEDFLGEVRDTGRSAMLAAVKEKVEESGTPEQETVNGALALRHAGDMKRIANDLTSALGFHNRSLAVFESLQNDREIARASQRVADDLEEQGHNTEALRNYVKAIAAWQRLGAEATADDCVQMAHAHLGAAGLNRLAGRSNRNATHLQHAIRIASNVLFGGRGPCAAQWKSVEPYPHPGAISVLSSVALRRAAEPGAHEDSSGTYALADHARRLRPQSVEARKEAFTTLIMRADWLAPGVGLKDYREALAGFDELRRWDPENRVWAREQAVAQLRLATEMAACHGAPSETPCSPMPPLGDAEGMVFDSLAALRVLSGQDRTNVVLRDHVTWALYRHAQVLVAAKRHDEAVKRIREAERLHQSRTPDPDDAEYRLDLGLLLQESVSALFGGNRFQEAAATVRRTVDIYERLVHEHPDNARYLDALANTRWWDAAVREKLGDDKGAETARAEAARAEAARDAIGNRVDHELQKLVDVDSERYTKGNDFLAQGNTTAALEELLASEAAAREYVVLRPAAFEGYFSLAGTYRAIAVTQEMRENSAGHQAALTAAMNAFQVAAWLAPEEQRKKTNLSLLHARNALTSFLFEKQRYRDAVPILRETVVLAQDLSQTANCPECRFILGHVKSQLALLSLFSGAREWEDVMRSGFIQMEAAVAEIETAQAFRALGEWRNTVARHLDDQNLPVFAAEHRRAALAAYREALRIEPDHAETRAAAAEIEQAMPSG